MTRKPTSIRRTIPLVLSVCTTVGFFVLIGTQGDSLVSGPDEVSALFIEWERREKKHAGIVCGGPPMVGDIQASLIAIGRKDPSKFQSATKNEATAPIAVHALDAFAAAGEAWAGQLLVDQFDHPDPSIRSSALCSIPWKQALWVYCDPRHAIRIGLEDSQANVRASAVGALFGLGVLAAQDIELLEQALSDPAWKVRSAAMSVLCSNGTTGFAAASDVLLHSLSLPDSDLANMAAVTLVRRNQHMDAAVRRLVQTIERGHEISEVTNAIRALAVIEEEHWNTNAVLEGALDHKSEKIRLAAQFALNEISSYDYGTRAQKLRRVNPDTLRFD